MPENLKAASTVSENFTPAVVQEWLPESLMACFVVGIVERLDLSRLESHYGDDRKQATNLRILLALLFHGYTSGIFSSRELEQATYDSEAFRFIAANTHPGHGLISSFRKRFLKELEGLFIQIMVIARSMGLVKQDSEQLDNKKLEEQLRREVVSMLIRAEKADAREQQHRTNKSAETTNREPEAGQTRTPSTEINEDTLSDPFSTYTFLSRKGAVQAQASGKSGSRMHRTAPWSVLKHPILIAKTLVAALFRTRPRRRQYRYRPAYAYQFLFLLILAGALLLTQYIDLDALKRPGTGARTQGETVVPPQADNSSAEAGLTRPATVVPTRNEPARQAAVPGKPAAGKTSDAGAIQTLARKEQQLPLPPAETLVAMTGEPASASPHDAAPESPQTTSASEPPPDTPVAVEEAETLAIQPEAGVAAAGEQAGTPVKTASHITDDLPGGQPADPDSAQVPVKARELAASLPGTVAAAGEQTTRREPGQNPAGALHREDWLLDQPVGRYMLQLLGTRFENALLEFVETHNLSGPLAYYKGSHKGREWYVLLYGNFSSYQTATAAVESLPGSISANRPWARKMPSIQTAILEERRRQAE